ncbi:hypothetical protein HU200_061517 [Digitaria exilis]|uniref:Uncharacterized protein n=1 Tax=Digitaria exilis TaxID=1010633 RepID=A0A835A8H2_9POAL|nr:hypothetical protein HU200_061517 [Digitaria exilis]
MERKSTNIRVSSQHV